MNWSPLPSSMTDWMDRSMVPAPTVKIHGASFKSVLANGSEFPTVQLMKMSFLIALKGLVVERIGVSADGEGYFWIVITRC